MYNRVLDDVRRLHYCFKQGLSLFHPAQGNLLTVSLRSKQVACLLGVQCFDLSEDYHRFAVSKMRTCIRESLEVDISLEEFDMLLSEFSDQLLFWMSIAKTILPATREWELPKRRPGRPAIPEEVKHDLEQQDKIRAERAKKKRVEARGARERAEGLARAEKLRRKADEIEAEARGGARADVVQ